MGGTRVRNNILLIEDGNSNGPEIHIGRGGRYMYSLVGNVSGASVQLEVRGLDGVTFIPIPDALLSDVGAVGVDIPTNCVVRAIVAGGTPSGLYAGLSLIGL